MNDKPRIVVLYAQSGALGHAVIAHNYTELLRKNGCDVTEIDVFECENGKDIRSANRLYFFILRTVPWVWRSLYKHWSIIPGLCWAKTWLLPRRFRRLLDFLQGSAPHILVTTHPIATSIASFLKAKRSINSYLLVVFSDWHLQHFWLFPCVDKYLVATEQQAHDLALYGIPNDAILPVGILINENYYADRDFKKQRSLLGISETAHVLLVMSGGTAWDIKKFVALVCELQYPTDIFIVGVPDALRKNLLSIIQKKPATQLCIHVLGRTDVWPYFAAADVFFGKPGSLTVAEALAVGIPAVLGFPMPGHEECNLAALASAPVAILPSADQSSFLDQFLANASAWKCKERQDARCHARLSQERILNVIAEIWSQRRIPN